jgi:hypothetical protein
VFIGDPISFPYPSFNITGVELTSDVTITVPNIISDYIIWYSYTDDTGLQHGSSVSFSISPINGIIDMDINILFTAINVIGNISLPIIVSTTGVASQTILLKANLVTAVLALTPATIDFGSVIVNETSEIQVRLTGDGLPPQLVISCNNDSRFTFSITSKSDPSTSYLTFAYFATNTGSIDMILYVQGKPTGSNTFTNTLSAGTVNTPGFSSANTSADMQIIGIISTLVAAPDNMSFPNTNTGSSSTYISFNLIGTNLSGNTTITPPTGYTVCKTSGGTYSSSISYTDVEIEAGVTTYVKFNPIATTTYTGNIVINNLLVSETISLSGTGISAGIPETLISLVADGSHLDSFSSYASQVFYNNTTIYEITYIAFGYVGASVPASTATIEIRDNSTNTLLHTENVSGTAAGGLKIVSLSAPIAVTSGQALKIKIIRLTGNWYLNRPTVDYSTLSVIDGVPFVHSFAMVITGNKH